MRQAKGDLIGIRAGAVWLCCLLALLGVGLEGWGDGVAAQEPRFRVVTAIPRKSFGYLPLYVAINKGFFREEGVATKVMEMAPTLMTAAMLKGEVDYHGAGASAIRGALQGAAIRVILFSYESYSWHLMAKPELGSVKDLKGKILGIDAIGSETEFAAKEVLRRAGLNPDRDVTVMAVGPGANALSALKAKAVDGTVLNADEAAITRKLGFKSLVFVGDVMKNPFSGFAAPVKKLKENPEEVRQWLRAMVRGIVHTRGHRDEVIELATREFAMERDVATAAVDDSIRSISRSNPGGVEVEGMKALVEIIKGQLKIKEATPLERVSDFALLKEVQRQLGVIR